MYAIVREAEYCKQTNNHVTEYVADSTDDLSNLPTVTAEGTDGTTTYPSCAAGSTVHVLSDDSVYRLSPSGTWISI